jgi:hypothetical protein
MTDRSELRGWAFDKCKRLAGCDHAVPVGGDFTLCGRRVNGGNVPVAGSPGSPHEPRHDWDPAMQELRRFQRVRRPVWRHVLQGEAGPEVEPMKLRVYKAHTLPRLRSHQRQPSW